MRIAIAQIAQESDTFNPLLTELEDFKRSGLFFGDEILQTEKGVGMIGGFLSVAEAQPEPVEIVPILRGWCIPGGSITAEALDYFEEKLVAGLKAALPVDALFFALHGACASEKIDDVEGHLLAAARRVVGPNVPIVSPFDHHGKITQLIIDSVDVLAAHETQPHDVFGTGVKAARLLFSLLRGEFKPTAGWQKIPMITPQDKFLTTIPGPMKEWFDLAREMETRPGVLAVSPFPMQPWLDVSVAGWSTVVYTDNNPELAQQLAAESANKAWELREQFWVSERVAPDEAVRQADEAPEGLVILSDTGDSVYGGAPGDSTVLLRAMLTQQITSTALVPMIDPQALAAVIEAGVGREIRLEVGGKRDNVFSSPLEVTGLVTAISDGLKIKLPKRGFSDVGRTALLEIGSIKLVLTEHRSFAISQPILYTHLGLDVDQAKMVVVKTASNFQYFDAWRKQLIRVDAPGMTQSNLHAFTWKKIPRPMYPLDDLPAWQAR